MNKSLSNNIGVIIPSRDKERIWLLDFALEQMKYQTMRPGNVFVIDYEPKSEEHDLIERYAEGFEKCKRAGCDFVLFIEDDDYYPRTYVEEMYNAWIDNGKPLLIGANQTTYYHLGCKGIRILKTTNHASAHGTGLSIKAAVVPERPLKRFYDIWLWKRNQGTLIDLENHCISIKHGIGTLGGGGHNAKAYKIYDDNELSFLESKVDRKAFIFYKQLRKELTK